MADKLVDMAYTKAEMKEERSEPCAGPSSPYPWGLCISLEKRDLEKLGVTQLPMVGSEVTFCAVATVTSVNQSAREGQDEESRVGLQITGLQLLEVETPEQEQAEGKETPATEGSEMRSLMGKYRS